MDRIGRGVEQATAVFDGAEITAVRADDGLIYASLPHLCRALGLDLESQKDSIEAHAILTEGLFQFSLVSGVRIIKTWCLRANLIALWLAVVPVKRLNHDKQQRIYHYQQKVADVLDRLFGMGPGVSLSDPKVVPVEYAEGLAIARMAGEQAQMALQKADAVNERVMVIEARLTALESRLMPREHISEEQAEQISDLVKQAALMLSQKLGGGNYFGTVYGQLYRTFGVTSYKLLTIAQHSRAVAWLEKMIREYS